MSRLAKKPVIIPQGVTVAPDGHIWVFKGPKGELKKSLPSYAEVKLQDGKITIALSSVASKDEYAMLGTLVALVKNYIAGVKDGYEKRLEIEGIGYKAQADNAGLTLSLGFTHPVKIPAPEGISFKVEKNLIIITGADKEKVGQIAAEIRAKKLPEPYKGKGIHYLGEVIRRKAGKKAVAAS